MPISNAFNRDCIEALKEFPDGFFDCLIADPPYGMSITARHKAENAGGGTSRRQVIPPVRRSQALQRGTRAPIHGGFGGGRPPIRASGRKNQDERGEQKLSIPSAFYPVFDDSSPPDTEAFRELRRVSKNQIFFGWNFYADKLPPASCVIVWDKKRRGMDQADCELAWTSFKGQSRIFEYRWNGMLQEHAGSLKEERIHACLPEGQLVYFGGKWKPIESVAIGESNEFGKVSAITSHTAERLVEIESDGTKVVATWNHPFLCLRGNSLYWVNADQIKKGDELLRIKRENTRKTTTDTTDTGKTKNVLGWNMILFGKKILAPFLKVCRFITRILTRQTMTFPICNLSLPLNTSGCTKVADLKMESGSNRAKNAVNSKSARQIIGITREDSSTGEYAKSVSSRKQSQSVEFELQTVGNVNIIQNPQKVFNLTLDGIPAFETILGVTHNTQKPIDLYRWIIRTWTKPGDKICDPYLGSGSSRIAAWDAGLDFWGYEIQPEYFRLQEERFQQYASQISLFN